MRYRDLCQAMSSCSRSFGSRPRHEGSAMFGDAVDGEQQLVHAGHERDLRQLAAGGLLLALFETSIAKMRVFRVPDFLGVALMLSLLGTLLLFVSRGL